MRINIKFISFISALAAVFSLLFANTGASAAELSVQNKVYCDSADILASTAEELMLKKKNTASAPLGMELDGGIAKNMLSAFNTGLYYMTDAEKMPMIFSEPKTVNVPVLLYHHLTEGTGYGDSVISTDLFEEHMNAIIEAGYTTVSLSELINYVYYGEELPEKTILVTFDDGYLSNYKLAYPILKKNNMKAAIFTIGWAIGKDKYKDGKTPMFEHFGFSEIREMLSSGLIEIQSHTYDCHQSSEFEKNEFVRESVLPFPYEDAESYTEFLENDFYSFDTALFNSTGTHTYALAYPHGDYSEESEEILKNLGVKITFSTKYDTPNIITQGMPDTLRALKRFTIAQNISADELVPMIQAVYGNE